MHGQDTPERSWLCLLCTRLVLIRRLAQADGLACANCFRTACVCIPGAHPRLLASASLCTAASQGAAEQLEETRKVYDKVTAELERNRKVSEEATAHAEELADQLLSLKRSIASSAKLQTDRANAAEKVRINQHALRMCARSTERFTECKRGFRAHASPRFHLLLEICYRGFAPGFLIFG